MKISIGPIQYYWERKKVFAFYDRLPDSAVDIVYLGETVCSKRRELQLADWLAIAKQLTAAGKEVILSTLALLEAESELASLQKIITNGIYMVEANDVAAVQLLAGRGHFVLGPHINVYNNETLMLLHEMGAKRWVIPVELGREIVTELLGDRPPGLESELFAYGRLPLAFSARCFSARAHNRPKDNCDFVCRDYPDGLTLYTQDEKPFLILNGIQVQSAVVHNLVTHLGELVKLGVDVIRIAPQAEGMTEIIAAVRDVLEGRLQPEMTTELLVPYQPYGCCDGYWYGQAGMTRIQNNQRQDSG